MARSIRMLQYLHTVHGFIHIVHIMHLHSPHSERRHDSIAYLINLSSIHVSTAVYANFFQTFKFMRKLNANGFHRSESTENNHDHFFVCFAVRSVIAFKMFARRHGILVVRLAGRMNVVSWVPTQK